MSESEKRLLKLEKVFSEAGKRLMKASRNLALAGLVVLGVAAIASSMRYRLESEDYADNELG